MQCLVVAEQSCPYMAPMVPMAPMAPMALVILMVGRQRVWRFGQLLLAGGFVAGAQVPRHGRARRNGSTERGETENDGGSREGARRGPSDVRSATALSSFHPVSSGL